MGPRPPSASAAASGRHSFAQAKGWRADAIAAFGAGRLSADRGPTLREAFEQWLAGARAGHVGNRSGDPFKPSAIRSYEQNVRLRVLPELGTSRLGDIRHRDLQALVDKLRARRCCGRDRDDDDHAAARDLPLRALVRGVVADNPTRGLELPAVRSKPRRFCSPVEAEQLLDALAATDRPLWATAFYAGLRRGELIALRWEDVDLATGVIHVRRGWDAVEGEITPKSSKGKRNVPIPAAPARLPRRAQADHRRRRQGVLV